MHEYHAWQPPQNNEMVGDQIIIFIDCNSEKYAILYNDDFYKKHAIFHNKDVIFIIRPQ